jgi:hypothetical protein
MSVGNYKELPTLSIDFQTGFTFFIFLIVNELRIIFKNSWLKIWIKGI